MTLKQKVTKARGEKMARIFYSWWGNASIHNRQWTLLAPDGDVEDYGTREHCVSIAKKEGWKYQVERHHRKQRGKVTILETNL